MYTKAISTVARKMIGQPKSNSLIYLITIIAFLLLNGCTTFSERANPYHYLSWPKRLETLQKLNNWQIQAVISLKNGNTTRICNIYWQQKAEYYNLLLSLPLQFVSYKITGNQQYITLWQQNRNRTYSINDAMIIIQQQLGVTLPLYNFNYWLKGIPNPRISYQAVRDQYNHIVDLRQNNWLINYVLFDSAQTNIDLPTCIYLTKENIRIKIIVKHWLID